MYEIVSTSTVVLDDGFVTTHAEIQAVGDPVRGSLTQGTLRTPGALIDGRWFASVRGAPQISTGETLFLVLRELDTGYLFAGAWSDSMYRKLTTESGALMVDIEGAVVSAVSCDGWPVRAVGPRSATASPDTDDLGVVEVDDPIAAGLEWQAAVDAFSACGGAR